MKIERGHGREFGDEDVRQALRDLYTSPANESYWSALERRIMSAVELESPREWWSHFPAWGRLGLSAAAAAVLLVAIATWHTRAAQQRLAYERLLGSPDETALLSETVGGERNAQREATLRYLITHD